VAVGAGRVVGTGWVGAGDFADIAGIAERRAVTRR
jgi:hypothetical protein